MKQETPQLPSHASVVVIGGGIMGCSTLYHLAKMGVSDAILLERNELTSGTTWHSAAQVRALRSTRNLTDLIKYSIELYSELEQETGLHTGWINKGSLSIATTPDRLTHIKRQQSLADLFGVTAQSITAAEAKERWPLMNAEDVIGAVWSPDDGRVSPSDLCAALIKGAKARGARVLQQTAVQGIVTEGNKIVAVETALQQIRCDAVVLCTGLWSRQSAAMAGVAAPLWPCEHFYLLTKPIAGIEGNMPTLSDHDSHLYIRDDSGGLLVGCFEPMGKPIDPATIGENFAFQLLPEDWQQFEPMMENALHRLPALADAQVKMLLNGPESFTPDGAFLLGESAETKGLYLGCGMNSVGVASGGGAGMALAHCVVDGRPPMDLHEVNPQRFGSAFNSAAALAARVPEVLGEHYAITYPGYQFKTARNLQTLPLHHQWQEQDAHFGQFGDWERPLFFACGAPPKLGYGKAAWFDQVAKEVTQAHQHGAIFDLSSFGKIDIIGKDAATFLQRLCANNMDKAVGSVIYSGMLNEHGGYESDLTALRLSDEHYRLNVATTAIKRDLAWLARHRKANEAVEIINVTKQFAQLALVGPQSARIARAVGADALNTLAYFKHAWVVLADKQILASRQSYVGEAGWELTCQVADVEVVYQALYDAGARPAGIYAQTSMRIEKRYLSYGHDIDTDTTPLQAGLTFAVDWTSSFIGKAALLEKRHLKPSSRILTLLFEDKEALPLGNEPVYWRDQIIGQTTSASYGHRIHRPIALAHVQNHDELLQGTQVQVDIAQQRYLARVSIRAAFDPEGLVLTG